MRRISVDEARLRPHLRNHTQLEWQQGDISRKDGRAVREDVDVTTPRGRVVVPSPGELRGVPVVGSGPGAIAGTNPAAALLAKERQHR